MTQELPIEVLLAEAKTKEINVTERTGSPFTQEFNGQLLGFEEDKEGLKER